MAAFIAWYFFISTPQTSYRAPSPQAAPLSSCQEAEESARRYEQSGPPEGVNVSEYIQRVEEESRRCGFQWCNPQYCH